MSKVKGTVTGCGKGTYSYFITLKEREGFYFNTKYEPKCGKGDVVGIEYEKKADNRGNVKRVEVIEKNSSGYEDTTGGGSGSGAGGGNRQDSIVWQSSRKDALVLAGILLSNEAFAVKGKADAKRTQIEELVNEITAGYFEAASDPKASNAYKTNASIKEDTPEDDDAPEEKKEGDEWDSGDEWDD